MIRRTVIVFFLTLLGSVGMQESLAQDFRLLSKGSSTSVANFVQDAFGYSQSSGSLIQSGTCMSDGFAKNQVVSDALPHPPEGTFHKIDEVLTALSRTDPNISWTRDSEGLLRVRDRRVRDDVLRIHLQRVHFKGAVTPDEAIWNVMSAPEVRAYFKDNHIEDGLIYNSLGPLSTKGLPRLLGDLRDVTVAQALDRIIRFFSGLWIYSECESGSLRRVLIRGTGSHLPNAAPSAKRTE